jgi:hypothetical protein
VASEAEEDPELVDGLLDTELDTDEADSAVESSQAQTNDDGGTPEADAADLESVLGELDDIVLDDLDLDEDSEKS